MDTKKCTKCGITKPLDHFGNNKSSTATHNSLGQRLRRPECKACTTRCAKERDKAKRLVGNPEPPPVGTPCEICTRAGTTRFPILRFDHCPVSLKFRGWICDSCNISIGRLGDDTSSLLNVLNYLNRTEKRTLVQDPTTLEVRFQA
jgi:hypothetical protein